MAEKNLPNGEPFLKRRKLHNRWRKVVTALASIVVFCTTYALILPAITLEQGCPLEEHTHTESCYETKVTKAFVCGDSPHRHTSDCYDASGAIVCGYADFYVHVHTEDCYGEDSQLLCPLPQIRVHTHTQDCYSLRTHTHGSECYSLTKGELICTQEESPGHTHDETCGGEGGCPLEETPGHVHTDDCYEWIQTLTCEIPEETWVLTCQRQEIALHTHTESCYDGSGNLVCGKQQVLNHVHGEACTQLGEIQVLTCTQTEHTHDETCTPALGEMTAGDGAMPVAEETATPTETTETTPLTLKPTSASLSYRKNGESNWTTITGNETNIPGDADFQLEVGFEVKIADLAKAGYQMVYSPLPSWFRIVKATDDITSGEEKVGTMTVDGETVTLTFDENWSGLNQETMTGSFYVEAKANLAEIPEGGKTEIKVGNTTITVNFDGDLIAQYGEVTIDKAMGKLEENVLGEDGKYYDYITYTLTVQAGADGCPAVTVTDSFTTGSQYVDSYTTVECPEGTTYSIENKVLTWNIGDMKPNTTQTLTYKVRLKPNYLGVSSEGKSQLNNTAVVYSKGHDRTSDTTTFTPVGKLTLSKTVASFQSDGQGGGTLTYTVWIQALSDNTYTMENAAIRDSLDGTVSGGNKTDAALLPYLSYVEGSFRLYEGGSAKINIDFSKNPTGAENLKEITPAPQPSIADDHNSFLCIVGDLKPGESRTLTYQIKIDPQAFVNNNEDFKIDNRAAAVTDPNRSEGGNQNIEHYNATKTITTKKWARKLLGTSLTEETTVNMGENGSFTVPAGSQEYKVVVNETGDWDVSSAVMKDDLNTSHMAYVGYVRVEAYQAAQSTNYGSDAAAAEALEKLTPVQTAWVDINGKTSFEFTPKDIGLPEGNYAYLLTYYAQPKNMEGYSTVIVANQFDLMGTVGINGKYYTLGGIHVSASVQLQGSNHFGAQKRFWYYDAAAEGQEKGTMYWVLKLSGSTIPGSTMLLDAIDGDSHTLGQVEQAFIAGYDLEFSEDQTLDNLGGTPFENFTSATTTNGLELTLREDVKLDGQCLYFIVSTYPTTVPQTNGQSQVYKNTLSTKDPGEGNDWVKVSEDQTYVVAGDNLYKEMAEVFEVKAGDTADTTIITHKQGKDDTILQKDYLMKSGDGVYVAWRVSVNHTATLNGRYRVQEKIPEGMELVYVQRYSTGERRNVTFQEIMDLGDNWTRVEQRFTYHDGNPTPAIYYVNGQNVIWEFEEKDPNPSDPDSRYVDYLVVCKVTDSDLFLSGKEKNYVNQVTLSDTAGNQIGKGSADVSLKIPTLSKTGTYDKEVNGGRYPFQIQLNELGTDLVPGAKTIKLIDEMCDVLILDPTSIKVVNTGTEEPVEFTAAVEGHTLTLTLPDNLPLTITYEANINALPGQPIEIKNNAHWEGYTTTDGGSWSASGFTYSVGATVDTSTNPELTVSKVDQYNTGQKLAGAEFTLMEMELQDGEFVEKSGGLTLTGITNENGEIVFGKDNGKLNCNVPYQLVETQAPEGYVLDDKSQYFVFARLVDKDYPAILESYKEAGALILYSTSYTHTALNHKGEILVEKKFENADGSPLGKVDGTYTFGLFVDGSTECLQTATLKWANGTSIPSAGKVHFTNVPLGKEYRVYELDSQGNPIKTGQGVVGGVPFLVSYPEGTVTVTAASPVATTSVTNRLNYAELPNTGGPGQIPYTIGGLLLLAVGLTLLYNQQKRRKEGRTS